MFFKYEPLANSVFQEIRTRSEKDLVDQLWSLVDTSHSFLKKFSIPLYTSPGALSRIIHMNLSSYYSVYLGFLSDLVTDMENLNEKPHRPNLLTKHRDVLTSPKKLQEYLRSSYDENDQFFRCLCATFHLDSHDMSKKSFPKPLFSSVEEQTETFHKYAIYVSTFLKNGYVVREEIENLSDLLISNLNVHEISSLINAQIKHIDVTTSHPLPFSRMLRRFIEGLEYFWSKFAFNPEKNTLDYDEYSIEYNPVDDHFIIKGEEGRVILKTYDDISDGSIPSLPFEFQRFIFERKARLLLMFPPGSIFPPSTSSSIIMDRSGFYIFKKFEEDSSYLEMLEISVDYLISRVLEDVLPESRNFVRSICCRADNRISRNRMIPNIPTIPRFHVMENLKGRSLYEHIGTDNLTNFPDLNVILMEVFASLQDAYEKCRFTHYDLHPGNIVFTPFDSSYQWEWNGLSYTIERRYRPVIIDFERSRVELEGQVLGRPWTPLQMNYLHIDINRSYPAHDIFKLLTTCYEYTKEGYLHDTISHFFGGEYCEWKFSYGAAMFSLPYLEKYESLRYGDIVRYLHGVRV